MTAKKFLAIIVILAAALLFAGAAQKSYWEDEAWTASIVQGEWDRVVYATASDVHPPLYFLLASTWGSVFGFEELGLRSLSIFFSVLSVVLVYCLAARLFDTRTGLIAAALLAVSPAFVLYGHNARYYALSAALALVLVALMLLYFRDRAWWALAAYVIAAPALLYTVYTSVVVIAAVFLLGILHWRWNRREVKQLLGWIVAHLLAAAAYLPWLPQLLSTTETQLAQLSLETLLGLVPRIGYLGFAFLIGETINPLSLPVLVGVAGIGLAFNAIFRYGRQSRAVWTVVSLLVISAAANLLINSITIYPQSAVQSLSNRSFYLLPFVIILLAAGLGQLRGRQQQVALLAVVLLYGVGLFNYFTSQQFMKPNLAVPWNQVMQDIQLQAGPESVVLCGLADSTCAYFLERYGFPQRGVAEWSALNEMPPVELWWLQSNLGAIGVYDKAAERADLEAVTAIYSESDRRDFAPHHPVIQRLKTALMGQDDYAYRLNVYRFWRGE
jgi:uncharacterized membrane protein